MSECAVSLDISARNPEMKAAHAPQKGNRIARDAALWTAAFANGTTYPKRFRPVINNSPLRPTKP